MHTPVTRRLRLATKAILQLLVSNLLSRMSTLVTRSLSTAIKATFPLHTLASLSLISTRVSHSLSTATKQHSCLTPWLRSVRPLLDLDPTSVRLPKHRSHSSLWLPSVGSLLDSYTATAREGTQAKRGTTAKGCRYWSTPTVFDRRVSSKPRPQTTKGGWAFGSRHGKRRLSRRPILLDLGPRIHCPSRHQCHRRMAEQQYKPGRRLKVHRPNAQRPSRGVA
jgi:hypothetical protein